MENISPYLSAVFILITIISVWLFLKAVRYNKTAVIFTSCWVILQGILAYTGFYTDMTSLPPRFMFAVAPPAVAIILLFATKQGRRFIADADIKLLTLLQTVRIPVELCLYGLFLAKAVPESMTFSGNNFDIISGITAPVVFFFAMKRKLNRTVYVLWNLMCLALLFNVVIPAVLSVPYSFQQFNFDQPNIGVLYFPFLLLPAFIVPVALFSHLVILKNLLFNKAGSYDIQPTIAV